MKSTSPLISIIIPIYNVEKYLKRCVDSVLSQNYKHIEVILVDDGSTDNSGHIVDSYSTHEIVRVIHKANGGVSSARNTGLKSARGEWISFIDPDDYVDGTYIQTLYDTAQKHDADIATCSFDSFTDDGSPIRELVRWPYAKLKGFDSVNDLFKNRRPTFLWMSLFKKALFVENDIIFPEGRDYEDLARIPMLLCHAKIVAYTNKRPYHYLSHNLSITGGKFSETGWKDHAEAIEDINRYFSEIQTPERFPFANYYIYCSHQSMLSYINRGGASRAIIRHYWRETRKLMKASYKLATFPSFKTRLKCKFILILSASRHAYSLVYKATKS